MNSNTGAIAQFETDADAIAAGFGIKLTRKQAEQLMCVSRDERIAALNSASKNLLEAAPKAKGSTFIPSPRNRFKKRK